MVSPWAEIQRLIRLGSEFIKFCWICLGILPAASWIASIRSRLFFGVFFSIISFNMFHKFSIGDRSGELAGHWRISKFWLSKNSWEYLEVWGVARCLEGSLNSPFWYLDSTPPRLSSFSESRFAEIWLEFSTSLHKLFKSLPKSLLGCPLPGCLECEPNFLKW